MDRSENLDKKLERAFCIYPWCEMLCERHSPPNKCNPYKNQRVSRLDDVGTVGCFHDPACGALVIAQVDSALTPWLVGGFVEYDLADDYGFLGVIESLVAVVAEYSVHNFGWFFNGLEDSIALITTQADTLIFSAKLTSNTDACPWAAAI